MRLLVLIVLELILLKLILKWGVSSIGNLGISVFCAAKRDRVGYVAVGIGIAQALGTVGFIWIATQLPFWIGVLAVSPGLSGPAPAVTGSGPGG
jgi:hypothetical protein